MARVYFSLVVEESIVNRSAGVAALLTEVDGAMFMSPLEHAANSEPAAIMVNSLLRFISSSPDSSFSRPLMA